MSSGADLKPPADTPSLDELNSGQRIEAMVNWFHENFEDPVIETPYESAEGGYIYVWGGPYDAAEELYNAFPDAPEEDLAEAVELIQSDGLFDWAPHRLRIQPDGFEYDSVGNAYVEDGYVEPDYFATDADTPQMSVQDRLDALATQLDRIEAHVEYWRNRPPGMGHNGAPDEFSIGSDDQDLIEAAESVQEVREQLTRSNAGKTADVEVLERAENRFKRLAVRIRAWTVKTAKKVLSGVAEGAGKTVGVIVTAEFAPDIRDFLIQLEQAASNVAHWIAHIQII